MTFEVMSHSAMYNLAHCQLVGNVASGALWMPMGNPANAFRSDFPVEGRPHSIGKPNMSLCVLYPYSSRHARHLHLGQCEDGGTKRKPPCWRCSKEEVSGKAFDVRFPSKWIFWLPSRPRYILGGIHMTNPAFLPNALLKEITGTEYNQSKIPSFFNANHNLTELNLQQGRIFTLANKPSWLKRIDPVSSATDIISSLPWWLTCNQARYPYWFGQSDPRNEVLLEAMQSEASQRSSNTLKISEIIV